MPTHRLIDVTRNVITRTAMVNVTEPLYPVPWHAFLTCMWTNSAVTDDCGNPPWIVFEPPAERMAL